MLANTAPPPVPALSLDAASALCGLSRRTLWRRLAAGDLRRLDDDARGRAMVAWDDVAAQFAVAAARSDPAQVLAADAGDAAAQVALGLLCQDAAQGKAACYWFGLAAAQDHADAMQWLGRAHVAGLAGTVDVDQGLFWIAKAATRGHAIAQAQLRGVLGASAAAAPPGPAGDAAQAL
ncbi:MAG: hypothetical protein Fur007_07560 [Rhodoferax sp.]